jgi:hypothetical protein
VGQIDASSTEQHEADEEPHDDLHDEAAVEPPEVVVRQRGRRSRHHPRNRRIRYRCTYTGKCELPYIIKTS